ncbi:hypothetical protein HYO11_18700 [Vibrio parahaemolyticus]|nr:hypothetical protein [Vibrio parahaemolyticus]
MFDSYNLTNIKDALTFERFDYFRFSKLENNNKTIIEYFFRIFKYEYVVKKETEKEFNETDFQFYLIENKEKKYLGEAENIFKYLDKYNEVELLKEKIIKLEDQMSLMFEED